MARKRREQALLNAPSSTREVRRSSRGKPPTDDSESSGSEDPPSTGRKTRSEGRSRSRQITLDDLPDCKKHGKTTTKNKLAHSDSEDDASYVPDTPDPPIDPRSPHFKPNNQGRLSIFVNINYFSLYNRIR